VFSGILALNYGWVSFSIARDSAQSAPSIGRIAAGPAAGFPHTTAAGTAMARYGSADHYDSVLTALLDGVQAGRRRR